MSTPTPGSGAKAHYVRQWCMAAISVAGLETMMASKDKGGRATKKPAAKDLKQKRLDKKAKKAGLDGKQSKLS